MNESSFRLIMVLALGVVVLLALAVILVRRGRANQPTCGSCGYAVAGLETLRCPECGCDLREVGIVTSMMRRDLSPVAGAVVLVVMWTVVAAILATIITTGITRVLPYSRWQTLISTVTYSAPTSQAYQALDLSMSWRETTARQTSDYQALLTLTTNDATDLGPLAIDLTDPERDVVKAAVVEWMSEQGIPVVDETLDNEVDTVVQFLRQPGRGRRTGGGRARSAGGALGTGRATFGSVNRYFERIADPAPMWFVVAATLFWFVAWLVPATWIIRRGVRRQREQSPASTPGTRNTCDPKDIRPSAAL